MADGSLATTYSLVYTFLKGRSHEKAAAAVKKAAKDTGVIILKDSIEKDVLQEIIKSWKIQLEHPTSESESSGSDSESSSQNDSSDSSNKSRSKDKNLSKANGKAPVASKKSNESSSEESDSDDDSEIEQKPGIGAKPKTQAKTPPKKPSPLPKRKDTPPSSSSNESGSSDSDSSRATSSSDSSCSSNDESDSESEKKKKGKETGKSKTVPAVAVAQVKESVKATKKRRLSESGQALVTAVEEDIKSPPPKQNGKSHTNNVDDNAMATTPVNGNKRPRKSNTPFQRVKTEGIKFHDDRLKDNTFMARGGNVNDYGAKANQDLIVTRGDSFRKEKNKKKRGSYRGGEITLQSHSIKFT